MQVKMHWIKVVIIIIYTYANTQFLLKCFNADWIIHKDLAAIYNVHSSMLVAMKDENRVAKINPEGEMKRIV